MSGYCCPSERSRNRVATKVYSRSFQLPLTQIMQSQPPPSATTTPRVDADKEPTPKRAKPPAPHDGFLSMLAAAQPMRFTTAPVTAAELAALDAPRPALEVGLCGVCAGVGESTPATVLLPHCGHIGMCAECKVEWAESWDTREGRAIMSLAMCPMCRQEELRAGSQEELHARGGPSSAGDARMDQGHGLERSSLPTAAAPP